MPRHTQYRLSYLARLRQAIVIRFKYPRKYPDSSIRSYLPRPLVNREVIIEEKVSFGTELNAIGDFTWIGANTTFDRCDRVGHFCSIGRNCAIGLANHPLDRFSTSGWVYRKSRGFVASTSGYSDKPPVRVGHDVLVSGGSSILEGVTLGNGSVVGAAAVVTKDTEPYGIYAGVPARLLRFRFSDDVISKLLAIDWSKLNRPLLEKLADSFGTTEGFLARLQSLDDGRDKG